VSKKIFVYLKNVLSLIPMKPTTRIAVTETWLGTGEETQFSLPASDFVVQSHTINRAGGVGLYIDIKLQVKV